MKIAIYGKGGIGKSTLSANIAAALAHCGKRVLQIGCDPKHDSTRLLLGGKSVVTALDYMKTTPVALQRLDRVLHEGYKGIVCAEAGGPEPGVGCAGRGILSTFALFERLNLDMAAFDVVIYDVLGDVVCGGFAVPLRQQFADRVYVVTSEEFMSLYAANNILKGVKNFDEGGHRLAGLILNSRGKAEDRRNVRRFARAVHLPIRQVVPRSDLFRRAELLEKTVVEAFPDSPEASLFHGLAHDILEDSRVYPALFLSEASLEEAIFKETVSRHAENSGSAHEISFPKPQDAHTGCPEQDYRGGSDLSLSCDACRESVHDTEEAEANHGKSPLPAEGGTFLSKSLLNREPLHGCAFSGALSTTTQIKDAITVAHGPRSCTSIAGQAVLSAGFRLLSRQKILLETQMAPAVVSSDMDESVVIYGGKERLINTLEQAMARKPGAVFLLTTCPAGVIGDDPLAAVKEMRHRHPKVPIIPVTTDGNLQGDYMQGVINACMEGAAALVDTSLGPEPLCVNILGEKNIAFNAESNFHIIAGLLKELGIRVNCRFVRNTSVDQLKGFCRASLNLPAYTDYLGRLMVTFVKERLERPTAALPFPTGFMETAAWIREIATFFHRERQAEALVADHRRRYDEMIAGYRSCLAGRRLMIMTYVHNVDWMVEAAFDLGMTVVKVCILTYSQDNRFITRYPGRFAVETHYDPAKRDDDIRRLEPDLVLGNYTPKNLPLPLHVDIIPLCPDVGFYGGLAFARRWADLIKSPVVEGWKHDGM